MNAIDEAYRILHDLRPLVLGRYRNTKFHIRYRDIRRGLANAKEEAQAGEYEHGFIAKPGSPLHLAVKLQDDIRHEESLRTA